MRTTILLAALLLAVLVPASPAAGDDYVDSIEAWRAGRVERLTSETGWLTVAGFFWLQPGDNAFGSAPGNAIALPEGSAPPHAGILRLETAPEGRSVRLIVHEGARVTVGEETVPVSERVLTLDPPDEVRLGRLTFWVMERGGELAVRLRDPECELRRAFAGIESWPVDPSWKVTGRWEAFTPPRTMIVPNFLGYQDTTEVHGRAVFTLAGRTLDLLPITAGAEDSTLFFVFQDDTTGRETYGGGRFLYAELEPDGRVVLDFNKAYNPPCAFNPWTTCPLPPEGNALPIPVTAGEKDYAGSGH